MVSVEDRKYFLQLYQKKLREFKGITLNDQLNEEMKQCGSRVEGNGHCSSHQCKCAKADTCNASQLREYGKRLHGDSSCGEVSVWDNWDRFK